MSDPARDDDPWSTFCAALARAGAQILRPDAPADPLTRAEGYRYLARLTRGALESCVEFADPEAPGFYSLSHETLKIGADNPDNFYQNASLDGRLDLRDQRHARHRALPRLQHQGRAATARRAGLAPTGFIDSTTLAVGADGRFELIVSATPHEGNWLPMTAGDVDADRAPDVPRSHERSGAPSSRSRAIRPPSRRSRSTRRRSRRGSRNAARFVEGTARVFADWARDFAAHPNALPRQDQQRYLAAGGDPSIHYYHGYYRLGPDEALVVEVPRVPPCESWNLQINNHWMESIDYRYHRAHVNKHTAVYDAGRRAARS